MKRSWKRILAGFLAACIVFGDSSLVYAAESTQAVVESSESEIVEEVVNEELIEEVVDEEISDEESETEDDTDAEVSEEAEDVVEDASEEDADAETGDQQETLEVPEEIVETTPVQSEISESLVETEANTLNSEKTEEPEIVQIPAVMEVFVNPLYEDVVTEEEIINAVAAVTVTEENLSTYTTVEAAAVAVREALVERNTAIQVGYEYAGTVSQDDLVPLADSILEEALKHTGIPKEGDYLRWNYAGYSRGGGGYVENGISYLTLQFNMSYYTTAEMEKTVDDDVEALLDDLALDGKNDYGKICAIYDYICANVTYDHANLNDDTYKLKYTAYAALIDKTAVCQGYAMLFYRLALEEGIDARIISGIGNGGPHGWNIVELNDKYYNLDATWDAGRTNYSYFLKNTEEFTDHACDEEYLTSSFMDDYPMATDSYTGYTGTVQQDGDNEILYIRSWEMAAAGVSFTDTNILAILNKRINDGDSFAQVFIISNQNTQSIINKDVWNAVKILMSNSEQPAGFAFTNEYYMDENWFVAGMQTATKDVILDATLTLGAAGEYGSVVFGNTDIPAESVDIRFNTTHWNDGTVSGEKNDYAQFVAAFGAESIGLDIIKNGTSIEDAFAKYQYYSENSGTVNLNLCIDSVNKLEDNVVYELTKKIASESYTGTVVQEEDGETLYIWAWEMFEAGIAFNDSNVLDILNKRIANGETFTQVFICYPDNPGVVNKDIWNAVKSLMNNTEWSSGFLFSNGNSMDENWYVADMQTATKDVVLNAKLTLGAAGEYGSVVFANTDIPATGAHVRFNTAHWNDGTPEGTGGRDDYGQFVQAFGTKSYELNVLKNGEVVEDTSARYEYYSENPGNDNLNVCIDHVDRYEANVSYDLIKKIQKSLFAELKRFDNGDVEGVTFTNITSESMKFGLYAKTEDGGYIHLGASEIAAGDTESRYFREFEGAFDNAAAGTWNLYTYCRDLETSELIEDVMFEDFTIEVVKENVNPISVDVEEDTGIWYFTDYSLYDYYFASVFMGPTSTSLWKLNVGADRDRADYFYLDVEAIKEENNWNDYEIRNIIFTKTVIGNDCFTVLQCEGTEFEFGTYEKSEDIFVLNKVYSTGISDEYQDIDYTYYFTPARDGYYGLKGDFWWLNVYAGNRNRLDFSYLKNSEDGNLERYFYLEAGVTYRFEFNIDAMAYQEKFYQLVMDSEGENISVLTVGGSAYSMNEDEKNAFRVEVSEAGLYHVSIEGGGYGIEWEETGLNNYSTGNLIYFLGAGNAYVIIESYDDITIQLNHVEAQSLELDEEVIVSADKNSCYEVDVENQNILYLKKDSGAFELIGIEEDGSGAWIDNCWIYENGENWLIINIPSRVNKLRIFFDKNSQNQDEQLIVTNNYQFENQLSDWSGIVKVPADSQRIFAYKGDVYGDFYISEPISHGWYEADISYIYNSEATEVLWSETVIDDSEYRGFGCRYYDSKNKDQVQLIFTLWNYTNEELSFELKTNEDFEIWELYDEGDGHTTVELNDNYYDYWEGSKFSYYRFIPEETAVYNVNFSDWMYRVSDRKLMPKYNVVLEAGEEYLIRFNNIYGLETFEAVECEGTSVRFTDEERIKSFTPTVSGDYYIEMDRVTKVWDHEEFEFRTISDEPYITLEAGKSYIFRAYGNGLIGLKNEITVLDYDYYHALIASGGSVSIVDGKLQIKEPLFGGFTLKEVLLSLLGLDAYVNHSKEEFMKANQYWVGESGAFASTEYYRLSEDGTLTDCAEDQVTAGDILVVKYEPEIVWVDSMKVSVDKKTLTGGNTAQISVSVAPATEKYGFKEEPEITYESSDDSIATVDENGVVTPHRPGKVTITVRADERLRYQENLVEEMLTESIEFTVTGSEFTVLDYDFLEAFIASGGSVSLNLFGKLNIEQKNASWNLISKIASFLGIETYEEVSRDSYIEANNYWKTEDNGSFVPVGYYDLSGNDISKEQAVEGGYAVVKYEPEYVWVDRMDMEVEDDVLTAGESTTLKVTPYAATEKYGFKSEPEIRLVSKNPEIADIKEDGTIETYKAGTAVIKAYADETMKYELGIGHTIVSDYVTITVEPEPITYTYEILGDGTARITGYIGVPARTIEIPSEIEGYPVTAIGEYAFLNCTNIEKVILPDSLESIDSFAFVYEEEDYHVNLDILFYASKGSYAYEWAKDNGHKVMDPAGGPYSLDYEDNGDGSITITGYVGDLPGELTIPSIIDGYDVNGIGFAVFMGCEELTEVVIPESVSIIENAAFRGCTNLKKVTLPSEMVSLGSFAFGECSALEELILPNGITSLTNAVICECDSLTSITLPNSIDSIEYHAISHCDNLEEVIIPDSVTYIHEYGIFNCPNLKEIELPNSIEYIGEYAFYQGDLEEDHETFERMDITIYASRKYYAYEWANNHGFTVIDTEEFPYSFHYDVNGDEETVTITGYEGIIEGDLTIPTEIDGYRVTGIFDYAFSGCSELSGTWVIPACIGYIGEDAFADCDGLTIKVKCAEGSFLHQWAIEHEFEYELVAFACDNFIYEILEDGTAKIVGHGEEVYNTLTIPAKLDGHAVSEIGDYAFYNCADLCELRLECEETLKTIGKNAFRGCGNLWSFTIPENLTSIGDGAFCGTGDWWILEIPESVISIGENAFGDVGSIYRVYLPESVTSIGENAFTTRNYNEDNKENTLLYCAKGSYAYNWAVKNGYNIYDTTAEREYQLTYTVLDEEAKTAAITGYTGEAGGTLTIPSTIDGYTVVEIADCAFDAEQNMEEHGRYGDSINFTGLELPDTLVRIGDQAFQSCKGLTGSLVIPDSVKEIGAIAFGWCNNLNGALIIPDSVEYIGGMAFHSCTGFTSLSIGTGLNSISYDTFANCRSIAGKLVIPENITSIDAGAFTNCFSLTEVHMPDTLEYIEGMCFYDDMNSERLDVTIYGSRRYYPYQWAGEHGFDRVDTISDQYFFTYEDIDGENVRITGIDGDAKGELIIPETIDGFTVTEISDFAFENCTGFVGKLEIPNTVNRIGGRAFYGCTGLTGTVVIPQNVYEINYSAFFNCTGLEKVYITEYTGYINDDAFMYDLIGEPGDGYEDKLLDITVICDKGSYAYDWARNLGYQIDTETALAVRFTYEVLEDGTARITKYNGMSYTGMKIPEKLDGYVVSEIGDYAFEECSEIYGTLSFPDSIVKIGEGAFSWCTGLYRVDLPSNLQYLGEGAFFGLSDLSKVFISESVTWIDENAFSKHDEDGGIVNQELTIYCTTGSYAWEWAVANGFRTFDFNTTGDYQLTYDVLDDGTICITGYEGTPGKNLVIPQIVDGYTVTKIGASAFEGGFEFSGSLLLPNTLKEIGPWAFGDCENISGTLIIPESVKNIGTYAFINCTGLEEVHIGNNVEAIGDYAFSDGECLDNLDITIHASRKHYAYSWADEFGFTVVDTEENPYEFTYEEIDWDAVRITGIDNGVAEGDLVIPSTIDGYIVKEVAGFNPENYKGEFTGTLVIPSTVRVLCDEAFKGNQKLTGTVVLPPHLESVGENVFEGCDQSTVKVKCVKDSYLYEVALANNWEIELYQCTSDGYTYEVLPDGTARITGFTGSLEFENNVDLIIPEKVDNYVVTEVGDAAFRNRCEFNGKLILPDTLKKIGDYAFNCCCGINGEVVIPDSVTEIGEGAFYYASVWRLTLPDNLKEIKARAFACTQLDERVIIPDKVTTIGEKAFAHDAITRLYVPNSVVEIADDAFYEMCGYCPLTIFCEKDSYAYNWAKEHDVEVVDLTSNGDYTINYVVIDENWKTALVTGYEGEAGGDLVIPDEIDGYKVVAIADNAFEGAYKFTGKLVLPEGLLNIGSFAFSECKELTGELVIPSTVGTISDYAFSGLENITGKLVIPDSVSLLGEYAFNYCPNITELYVGSGVTKFDYDVFSGCKSLKIVVCSENLKEIESGAFCECDSLEDVYLPYSLERIDKRAFSTYDENGEDINLDVTIHASRISYAYEWAVENGFDVVDTDAGKTLYYYDVLDADAKTIRITGIDGKPEKDFVIPETYEGYTVTEIGDCAFAEYEEDESRFSGTLTIPNTITSIGDHAFEGCSGFTGNLVIPDSITYIANGAFVGCSGFESLTLSNNLEVIPENAFLGMNGLKGNIVIPDKVTEIHLDAFSNCTGIVSVQIPESVTSIDSGAFYNYETESNLNIKIYCSENSYASTWANENGFETAVGETFEVTLVTNGGTIEKDNVTEYVEGIGAILPTEVVKAGYTFEGWYADEECTGESVLSIGKDETGNKTFYAKWTLEEYTITYHENEGPTVEDAMYNILSEAITLPVLEREAYIFAGWYDNASFTGTKVTEIPTGSTGNRTFYAKWTPVPYTITYHANGGTLPEGTITSYTVEFGTITFINPTRNGYEFQGWYNNSACILGKVTEIPAGSMGDVEIYAKWKIVKYNIDYELHGGTNNSKNPTDYTVEDDIVLYEPTREGYEFLGWYDESGNKVSNVTELEENQKLYAEWGAKEYDITYNVDGGTIKGDYVPNYTIENKVVLPEIEKDHYEFDGWYTDESFTEKVTVIEKGNTGDRTFYAKWVANVYNIEYELNDDSLNRATHDNPPTYTIETATFQLLDAVRAGYEFQGWYSDVELKVGVDTIETGSPEDIKLYADWKPMEYDLVYELNDSEGSSEAYKYTAEDEVVLITPGREGYEFGGWYKEKNFSGTPVEKINKGSTGDCTFYAKWTPIEYNIQYVLNDSDLSKATHTNPETYTIETATFKLENAKREGYKSRGWYADAALNDSVDTIEKGNVGELTLYADWEAVEYEVIYNLNGGKFETSVDEWYTIEDVHTLEIPKRDGYEFAGWYDNKYFSGTSVESIEVGNTGNQNFYAKWTPKTYQITYELNGGTNVTGNPNTYTIETATITLKSATRTGYTFEGWYSDEECTEQVTKIVKGSFGERKLYADWKIIDYKVTYNLNGGKFEAAVDTSYTFEEALKLAVPTRKGYTFKGWYAARNLSGNEVTEIAAGTTGAKSFYAKWERNEYKINYVLNEGTNVAGNPETYHVETATFKFKNATRTGYNFTGWYSDELLTNKVTQVVKGSAEDITLYAGWELIDYKISYVLNGGTLPANVKTSYQVIDEIILEEPTRIGYEFSGWYTNAKFNVGSEISGIAQGSTGAKTVYAKWTAISYDIMYVDGEDIDNASYTIESKTFNLPALTKLGYKFIGWYNNSEYLGTPVKSVAKGSSGNKTFYAKWEIEKYAITYNLNKGELPEDSIYEYVISEEPTALPVPTRRGYEFAGWYTTQNFKGECVADIPAGTTKAKTFYAKWNIVNYAIEYDEIEYDGITFESVLPEIYTVEQTVKLPEAYRFGYDFLGWYEIKDGNKEKVTEIPAGSVDNKVLCAEWNWNAGFTAEVNTSDLNVVEGSQVPTIIVPYGKDEFVNINVSLTSTIGVNIPAGEVELHVYKGKYTENEILTIVNGDGSGKLPVNMNANAPAGYEFDVVLDPSNGIGYQEGINYTVAAVFDYEGKMFAPSATFQIVQGDQPLPINQEIEWEGISNLESLKFEDLVKEDRTYKEELIRKLFTSENGYFDEEFLNGTIGFNGVKITNALKSGTYTLVYEYTGSKSYEKSAEATLKVTYAAFTAAGVEYRAMDNGDDVGAIVKPGEEGFNATSYATELKIVPLVKTPSGEILAVDQLVGEGYDVNVDVSCTNINETKEDKDLSVEPIEYGVKVTAKNNPTKTLTKKIQLSTIISLHNGKSATLNTTVSDFKVYSNGSEMIKTIVWAIDGNSETSYIYKSDVSKRTVPVTVTATGYDGSTYTHEDKSLAGKLTWSTSNKTVADISVDKKTGQPTITIPKNAEGVTEIKAVAADSAKKEIIFKVIVVDLGVRAENTKLTLNSKMAEPDVIKIYPNILAKELYGEYDIRVVEADKNGNVLEADKQMFVLKANDESGALNETSANGELKIGFAVPQTGKKNHTVYLKAIPQIAGMTDDEKLEAATLIKATISDKCVAPTVSGKVTVNYNKAMSYETAYAEVLLTLEEPLAAGNLEDVLKLSETTVPCRIDYVNTVKVSDTQYRVKLVLDSDINDSVHKTAKQMNAKFKVRCQGYLADSVTGLIKVPINSVNPTFKVTSALFGTPVFYRDFNDTMKQMKVYVDVPEGVTVREIKLTANADKLYDIQSTTIGDTQCEVTLIAHDSAKGGDIQFDMTCVGYANSLQSTKLKAAGRTIASESITLYDRNTEQKAASSFTFSYGLLGKERINLYGESQYLTELVEGLENEKIELDIQPDKTAEKLMNKNALVVNVEDNNVSMTATKDAFDAKLKSNVSCKVKVALKVTDDNGNVKVTKAQTITITFSPKTNTTSVTLKATGNLNVADVNSVVTVKPTIKNLAVGAKVESIIFKNVTDAQNFELVETGNGTFTIGLQDDGVNVPSGKNTVPVIYGIRTASGELMKVEASAVINVVQTASIKLRESTITLYNSVIGDRFAKLLSFTESKFGGKISVEIDEASRNQLKNAGISIVEVGKEPDYEGASEFSENVEYKVYVDEGLSRGQEKTYTVKAKVSLLNSATKKGEPITYNVSFKVKLAK